MRYVAYTIANSADAVLTYVALAQGYRELNPVVRWLMGNLGVAVGLAVGWLIMQVVMLWPVQRRRDGIVWFVAGAHVSMAARWAMALARL